MGTDNKVLSNTINLIVNNYKIKTIFFRVTLKTGILSFGILFSIILFVKLSNFLLVKDSLFILTKEDVLISTIGFLLGSLLEITLYFRKK